MKLFARLLVLAAVMAASIMLEVSAAASSSAGAGGAAGQNRDDKGQEAPSIYTRLLQHLTGVMDAAMATTSVDISSAPTSFAGQKQGAAADREDTKNKEESTKNTRRLRNPTDVASTDPALKRTLEKEAIATLEEDAISYFSRRASGLTEGEDEEDDNTKAAVPPEPVVEDATTKEEDEGGHLARARARSLSMRQRIRMM